MTTRPKRVLPKSGLGRLAGLSSKKQQQPEAREPRKARLVSIPASVNKSTDKSTNLMKVSHALTLIYISLLLAFSIVAVENNRIRKSHSELLEAHDALYVETQTLRLQAADITSPLAIRSWARSMGMVPYYSSDMTLEKLEPTYTTQTTVMQPTVMQPTATQAGGQ